MVVVYNSKSVAWTLRAGRSLKVERSQKQTRTRSTKKKGRKQSVENSEILCGSKYLRRGSVAAREVN